MERGEEEYGVPSSPTPTSARTDFRSYMRTLVRFCVLKALPGKIHVAISITPWISAGGIEGLHVALHVLPPKFYLLGSDQPPSLLVSFPFRFCHPRYFLSLPASHHLQAWQVCPNSVIKTLKRTESLNKPQAPPSGGINSLIGALWDGVFKSVPNPHSSI